MGYIIAFIIGIYVATVGVSGLFGAADRAVHKTQEVIKDASK